MGRTFLLRKYSRKGENKKMKSKKLITVILMSILIIMPVLAFAHSEKETSEIKAESIKITANPNTPVRITNMKNIILSANIYPENTTDKTIKWSTSDESIAKINPNGKLTCIKDGKVKVTAETSNGIKDEMQIEFKLQLKERISIIIILTIFLITYVILEKKNSKKTENK